MLNFRNYLQKCEEKPDGFSGGEAKKDNLYLDGPSGGITLYKVTIFSLYKLK
jgi:hypothetical protein